MAAPALAAIPAFAQEVFGKNNPACFHVKVVGLMSGALEAIALSSIFHANEKRHNPFQGCSAPGLQAE
jgi:hypothetical protein